MRRTGLSARTMNIPGEEYIAAMMRSRVSGLASAALASSPATRPRSSWFASSSGTFSVLPLVFFGAMRRRGSCAFTISAKVSPYTGKPPPGVAVPRIRLRIIAFIPRPPALWESKPPARDRG